MLLLAKLIFKEIGHLSGPYKVGNLEERIRDNRCPEE